MTSGLTLVGFGLASAACWGAGDFSGGLATRRTRVYGVVIASQVVGVTLLTGLALVFGERMPGPSQMLWGGVAGLCGGLGLIALYRALASGRMGVAAPVSAILTAMIPVLFGISIEGLPGVPQLTGFGLAMIAVWLISRSQDAAVRLHDLRLPVVAGVLFGFFLTIINRLSAMAILWPLVAARMGSLVTVLAMTTLTRQPRLPESEHLPLTTLVGVLDAAGNTFFALAGRVGRLDVAAVLSSLYPATTVWLAWLILKERITRLQTVGVIATLAAIALIAS